jgi:hypothetical protein
MLDVTVGTILLVFCASIFATNPIAKSKIPEFDREDKLLGAHIARKF